MTRLAETAFSQLRELPDDAQDRLAQLLLDEMESSKEWDTALAANPDKLEAIARSALTRDSAGESVEKGWDEL